MNNIQRCLKILTENNKSYSAQDTTFIGRTYHKNEDDDFHDNVEPLLYNHQTNEIIEVEEQYSRGKLIGWTIITTWS